MRIVVPDRLAVFVFVTAFSSVEHLLMCCGRLDLAGSTPQCIPQTALWKWWVRCLVGSLPEPSATGGPPRHDELPTVSP